MKTNSRLIEALESRIAPAFAASGSLAGILGANGFQIDGVAAGDLAGASVADAGDIDNDGYADILIGAPSAAGGKGEAYLVYGQASGFPTDLNLSSLAAADGFKLTGLAVGDKLGASVSGAGDVNGDGFDDLILGAPSANNGNGAAYVVFGKSASFGTSFDLSTLTGDGVGGFRIAPSLVGESLGASVAGVGDFNGDGFDDIIVGAPQADIGAKTQGGVANVIFGRSNAAFTPNATAVTSFQSGLGAGFNLLPAGAGDHLGTSVSAAGDVNGDGLADLIVGAPDATSNGNTGSGRAYVVFGQAGPTQPSLDLTTFIAGDNGFRINGAGAGDGAGRSVSGAGDLNGDGFADLIVGSTDPTPGTQAGESYVIYGKSKFLAEANLSSPGALLNNVGTGDMAGVSVSSAGDFNGDGFSDLIVSAPGGKNGVADDAGKTYVVFGSAAGLPTTLTLSNLNGTNGFALTGALADDGDGQVVSAAGDVNGDGFDDLLIGQPGVDSNGHVDGGRTFLVFGSNGNNQVTVTADGKTATYTDVDGDLVTVKSSVGKLTPDLFKLSGANADGGSTLRQIDIANNDAFKGASFTISAKPQLAGGTLHGDGLANIGAFDADSVNLGTVKIAGDVGHIDASTIKALTVNSLGAAGLSTQAGHGASLNSVIGKLPQLNVKTNVDGVFLTGANFGKLKVGGDVSNSSIVPTSVLKSLTIGGDLDHSRILGGYTVFGVNADAQIGKIAVKGDWNASTAVAGIVAGNDGFYGTADDKIATGGKPEIASRIASIVIGGQATGSFEPGGHFAIEAQQIGSVTVGKTKLALKKTGALDDFHLGSTGDFRLLEIA